MIADPAGAMPPPYSFPFPKAPEIGEVVSVVPGVRWLRLPLPFRLNHVNIYLLEDYDGWAIFDCGISAASTVGVWDQLFVGPLRGTRVTRVICSHHHPDHIGLAGWLCNRFDVPLLTSYSAYSAARLLLLDPKVTASEQSYAFYRQCGMTAELSDFTARRGLSYLKWVSPLPDTFLRVLADDTLSIGGRRFRVLTGDGHAPEQVMLYCSEGSLLLAADQIMENITPNISVWATEPDGDPLGHYMRKLRELGTSLPDDTLVLPGHNRPFRGANRRCHEILVHHEARCRSIIEACKEAPKTLQQLLPVVFGQREWDAEALSFASTETMAHVNRLVRRGELNWHGLGVQAEPQVACT